MQFSHLHCHTQYSLLDGAADIKKLFKKAKADDMPAIEFFNPFVSDLACFNADWNPAVLSVSSAVSLAIRPGAACQSKPDLSFTLAKK